MDKTIKILCVCGKGNVRSVATKYALNRRGYNNVLTVGSRLVSSETLTMLYEWADLVLVAKRGHAKNLPNLLKVNDQFTIGDDRWGNPVNLELEEIIDKQLDLINL